MAGTISGTLIDNYGRPIVGASVSVYKFGVEPPVLASLFSDDALTAGVSNPLTSETDGSYFAYAPNGKYYLINAKDGYSFDSTDSVGVLLFDPSIVRTVVTTDTLTDKDQTVLLDATGASFTFNLLPLASVYEGQVFNLVKIDPTANTVTLDPNGSETINGSSTLSLTGARQGVVITKAGGQWITMQTVLYAHSENAAAGVSPLGRSSDGKLVAGWGGGASSLATLNTSSTVVENPANATATPTINKIPIANVTGGKLAWGWKPAYRGALVKIIAAGQDIAQLVMSKLAKWNYVVRDTDACHWLNQALITMTVASPAVFTLNTHGFIAGEPIYFTSTGALPTGLTIGAVYYVIAAGLTLNEFEVSATIGGAAINTSGTQSGVHTAWSKGSRLNVMSGVSKVIIRAQMGWAENVAGLRYIGLWKNGKGIDDVSPGGADVFAACQVASGTDHPTHHGFGILTTPVLDVVPGDYFELVAFQNTGGAIVFAGETFSWFEMEIVE